MSRHPKARNVFLKFLICKRIKVLWYLYYLGHYLLHKLKSEIIFDHFVKNLRLLPSLDLLTLQNNALLHLEKKGVHAPRLIVRNSVSIFSVPDRVHSGQCCVRMLSWVKGRVFGDFQPQSLQLMESLGQLLATVDNVRYSRSACLTFCARA